MKILKIDDRYVNMDHILCYDVKQTDRGPERIINFTVCTINNIQLREAFFTKTCKFSSHDVKQKLLELFCYEAADYISFYNVCKLLEEKCD